MSSNTIKIKTTLPSGSKVTNTYGNGVLDQTLTDRAVESFARGIDALQKGEATNVYLVNTKEIDYSG